MPDRTMPNVVGTIIKLLIVSLVVGVILSWMDLDALGFLRWIGHSFQDIVAFFGEFARWALGPILVGAVLVVPIWLIFFVIGKLKSRS